MLMYVFTGSPLHNILQTGISYISNISRTPTLGTVGLQEIYDPLENRFLGKKSSAWWPMGKV